MPYNNGSLAPMTGGPQVTVYSTQPGYTLNPPMYNNGSIIYGAPVVNQPTSHMYLN
jgi:hypothetical protein